MRNDLRFVLTAAGLVTLFAATDILPVRSAGAAPPPSTQSVQIVNPLTANGSVPVEATVKGVVRTLTNPALTHVGVLAGEIVTIHADDIAVYEIRSDGTFSLFTAVPAGKALILTDIDWKGYGTPGTTATFTLQMGQSGVVVCQDSDKYDENGVASRHLSMTAGIAFGPGTTPVFTATNVTLAHGYYVDLP